jgi:copper chaperone CopZ
VFENTNMLKAIVPALLTVIALGCSAGLPAGAKDSAAPAEKDPLETTLPAYNHNALHRVDFRVTGKNCAVCLHKIQERMKGLPGTVEAAVMLKKPFGAVVIYDSSKLNLKAILDIAVKGEPEVKIVDVKDESIKKLPVVLIPAYSQVPGEG